MSDWIVMIMSISVFLLAVGLGAIVRDFQWLDDEEFRERMLRRRRRSYYGKAAPKEKP